MMPNTVNFTELEVDPRELLYRTYRKVEAPWPATWTRHRFEVHDIFDDPIQKLDKWLHDNLDGCWGSYSYSPRPGMWLVTLFFEILNEAIMFRLKDGETGWQEQ